MALTSVAVSPATAMLRLGRVLGMTNLPRYVGSCGRLSVYQGDLATIQDFVSSDWSTRAELASQILSLVNTLLTQDSFVFLAWNLTSSDLAVTNTGQVVLTGLDQVTPVDKTLLETPGGDRPVCNQECFDKFHSEVMMVTPRGQPGRGCGSALQYGDMMYSHVCRHVFSDTSDGPGLLHSAPPEVTRLVSECEHEQGVGGRWKAVDNLVTVLDNIGSEDDDTNVTTTTEYDDSEESGDSSSTTSGEDEDNN